MRSSSHMLREASWERPSCSRRSRRFSANRSRAAPVWVAWPATLSRAQTATSTDKLSSALWSTMSGLPGRRSRVATAPAETWRRGDHPDLSLEHRRRGSGDAQARWGCPVALWPAPWMRTRTAQSSSHICDPATGYFSLAGDQRGLAPTCRAVIGRGRSRTLCGRDAGLVSSHRAALRPAARARRVRVREHDVVAPSKANIKAVAQTISDLQTDGDRGRSARRSAPTCSRAP